MRILKAIAVMTIMVLISTTFASAAYAHATLISSEPADGSVVPTSPRRLLLTFNEPVSALVLRLVAPDGTSEVLQAKSAADGSLTMVLPALRAGTHVLSWRVVSLDGHPIGGTVSFSIGSPSPSLGVTTPGHTNRTVSVVLWAAKTIFYIGIIVGIGGSFFLAWFAPSVERSGRREIVVALASGLVATVALVGLQGADALERSLSELSDVSLWYTGFSRSFGATAIVAIIAFSAALFALKASSPGTARLLSLFGVAATGGALALCGHASTAAPQWMTRPTVVVHVVSVLLWIGALVPLGTTIREGGATSEVTLVRFSGAIPLPVAALVLSGAALAIVQVADPAALLATAYGWILCAKLGLVALLLAIAAWNRFYLTPALLGGSIAGRKSLARSIALEIVISLMIVGLVAASRFTPPPRALAVAAAQPVHVHIHAAAAMADVTIEPGRAGFVHASIALLSSDFGPLDAKEVRLSFENKAAGIEAISRPAIKRSDATWQIEKIPIPMGGRWNVQVEILINDFEKMTLDAHMDIRNN